MDKKWVRERRFNSLSVRDLLDAREAYHVHLAHLDNVFATAIGRYLIMNKDPDAVDQNVRREAGEDAKEPRTLCNASATKWSWPCILVFVDRWLDRAQIAERPDAMVPPFLYLPDGRVIPTCVVVAERDERAKPPASPPAFPVDLMGGGYPALTEVQGERHLGSIGCLVTDGDSTYVLTNRHVTGEKGREVYTVVGGRRERIGESAGREIGKRPFTQIYAGWPGSRVLLNLDAGLIRVDDVNEWTAQVYGIGELGPVWDLNVDTFNLDMIGCPVRAHGAASGPIEGQIQALFFRYKTVGGFEYASDFLIGPRPGSASVGTKPGDSGTIWFEDRQEDIAAARLEDRAGKRARRLRPFAMQWGGQTLLAPESEAGGEFALATALSTVCRDLDVEIIPSWNVGHPETWGAVGHFKIGALACELVWDAWLGPVFMLNQKNIGYADKTLKEGVPGHGSNSFVPLADVADFVWRDTRKADENNHFADMDEEAESGPFKGKTLLSLTQGKPEKIDPDVWNDFYENIGAPKRGALPFRVWQIYDEMVDFARNGKLLEFVCAGGLMAHYVGDACQPLHVSKFHHGRNSSEKAVHSAYETTMLNQFTDELIAAIATARAAAPVPTPFDGNGRAAAVEVTELMRRTVKALPPLTIVKVFVDHPGPGRTQALWDNLGTQTAERILDGATTLARFWEGAWRRGRNGLNNPAAPNKAFSHKALMDLYNDDGFLQSFKLQQLTRDGTRLVPIGSPKSSKGSKGSKGSKRAKEVPA